MALRSLFARHRPPAPVSRPSPARNDVAGAPPAPRNRRLVSGERVVVRCSLELPKRDPFSSYRARCEGFIVLNVRGGSLYMAHPLNDDAIREVFPDGKASRIRRLTLFPEGEAPIVVGDLQARHLKTRKGERLTGLVLRFVGLDERQIDVLNGLSTRLPSVDGDEESAVPFDALHRL